MLWSIIGSSVSTLAIPLVTSQSFSATIPIVSPIIVVVAVRVFLGCAQGMFNDSIYNYCKPIHYLSIECPG